MKTLDCEHSPHSHAETFDADLATALTAELKEIGKAAYAHATSGDADDETRLLGDADFWQSRALSDPLLRLAARHEVRTRREQTGSPANNTDDTASTERADFLLAHGTSLVKRVRARLWKGSNSDTHTADKQSQLS